MPIENGTLLENRYRVETLLNVGGMGAVYRAWDTRLDCYVALKENTLEMTPSTAEQFMREAKTLARLRHPHLPRVSDYFVLPNGAQYLVMEYVEGDDLAKRIEWHGPMEEAEALAVIEQVCDALTYLHSQSPPVIHRDVKPANIKITPQGEVILVDFGIVKVGDAKKRTATGAVGVSPGYSPLEQYGMGGTDVPSDIYALGATLYTMLTGEEPPESVQRATGEAVLSSPRTLRPALSTEVAGAIETAMAISPTDRPATIAAFKRQLQRKAKPAPPPPPVEVAPPPAPKPAPAPPKRRKRRRWLPGCIGGTMGIIAVIVGAVLILSEAFNGGDMASSFAGVLSSMTTRSQEGATTAPSPTATATERPEPTPTATPTPMVVETWVSSRDNAVMVYVPAGTFQMGSTEGDDDEQPLHTVYLDAFWIDQTEVTNGQYQTCVEVGACEPPSRNSSDTRAFYYNSPAYENHPVLYVSWQEAQAYCTWVDRRLPTEAEWEKAARGERGIRLYPWGDEAPDCSRANHHAPADEDCMGDTAEVGHYPLGASPYGAWDMAGNVWEWVADWYGEYPLERQENPPGPERGVYRVVRGGSFTYEPSYLRTTYRYYVMPNTRNSEIGFRCVRGEGSED